MEEELEQTKDAREEQSGAPQELLGTLLANPALIERVGAVLGAMRTEQSTPAGTGEPISPANASANAAGDGIAALLQNPMVLEKLPQMLAVIKPLLESNTSQSPSVEAAVSAPSSPKHNREHLLLSLKPFLSRERCDAVDAILRISQLGEILGKLK